MTVAEIREQLNSLPSDFDDKEMVFVVDEYSGPDDSCGCQVPRVVDSLRFRSVHNWVEIEGSYVSTPHRWLDGELEDLPERMRKLTLIQKIIRLQDDKGWTDYSTLSILVAVLENIVEQDTILEAMASDNQ